MPFEGAEAPRQIKRKEGTLEASPEAVAALPANLEAHRAEEVQRVESRKPIKMRARKNGRVLNFTRMEVNGEMKTLEDTNAYTESVSEAKKHERVSKTRLKAYERTWKGQEEAEKAAPIGVPAIMPIGVNPDMLEKGGAARTKSRARMDARLDEQKNIKAEQATYIEAAMAEQVEGALTESELDAALEKERLESAAFAEADTRAEKEAQLKALYHLKEKYGSVKPATDSPFRPDWEYEKKESAVMPVILPELELTDRVPDAVEENITAELAHAAPVEVHPVTDAQMPQPERPLPPAENDMRESFTAYQAAMARALGEEEPNVSPRMQRFIDNARRVNDEATAARTARPVAGEASQPETMHMPSRGDEQIFMRNTILARQAGLKKVGKFNWGDVPESSLTQRAKGKPNPTKSPRDRKRLFGGIGLVGLGAAVFAFMQGGDKPDAAPKDTRTAASPAASRAGAEARAERSTDAPPPVVVPVQTPEISASIEKRGEGADKLFERLLDRVMLDYPDGAPMPPLVAKLFTFKDADDFSRQMGFEKLPKSSSLQLAGAGHAPDTLKITDNGKTLVYIDSNNQAHALWETKPDGTIITHPAEGLTMRPYRPL